MRRGNFLQYRIDSIYSYFVLIQSTIDHYLISQNEKLKSILDIFI
jgi:hypothetical protein